MNKGISVLTWIAVVVFFAGVVLVRGQNQPTAVPTATPIVRVQKVYVYPTPTRVPAHTPTLEELIEQIIAIEEGTAPIPEWKLTPIPYQPR